MTESLAQVGESWGGYTIIEVLGQLGLAERYRVRDAEGTARLLDVLPIQHPTLVARLRGAGLNKVVHPNLLTVRDVVPVLRFPGVVCSDVVGQTLRDWLKTEPPLAERLIVFDGICAAVAELHASGVAHGYLQPEVVVVELLDGEPFPRVALPGVATVVYAILREGGTVSSSGASLGARAFQAPEHQRNPSACDVRSDAYALGCLLYWLMTGKSPLKGLDPLASYEAARNEQFVALDQAAPWVSADVAALTRDLLRADPDQRPTAEQVLARLDGIHGNASASVGLWPLAVGAGIGLVVVAAIVAGLWWWM